MLILMTILAQVADDAADAPPVDDRPWFVQMISSPMFLIFGIMMIFLVISTRTRRAQERQKQAIMDQMKRGDRVQTIGGILGNVVEVRPEKVLVKVDESSNTKIWFSRNAIARVLEEEKAEAK